MRRGKMRKREREEDKELILKFKGDIKSRRNTFIFLWWASLAIRCI